MRYVVEFIDGFIRQFKDVKAVNYEKGWITLQMSGKRANIAINQVKLIIKYDKGYSEE